MMFFLYFLKKFHLMYVCMYVYMSPRFLYKDIKTEDEVH